ncbi:hypothetical protein AHAS_Ahas16G0221900 [Arachis hypogaea]
MMPPEVNSFKGKKFLFKVSIRLEDMNAFQSCKIVVLKLTEEKKLLSAFASKHKIYDETSTQSCEIITLNGDYSFVTPQRSLILGGWTRKLLNVFFEVANFSTNSRKTVDESSPTNQVEKSVQIVAAKLGKENED